MFIPEEIRESLHLREGDQFVVIGAGDTVVLKAITPPSMNEFKHLMVEVSKQGRTVKMKKSDVVKTIKKVRQQSK